MTQSRHMTLESVCTHPGVLAPTSVLLFATLAPVAMVARVVWHLSFAYFVLVLLDQALIKYHLWGFTPATPQPKRFALITGDSSGIGREMAFQLAEKGYSLVLVARTQSALDKTQSEILALHDGAVEVLTLSADLSTTEGIQSVIDFAVQRALVVDILINNAFVARNNTVINFRADEIDEMLTLNVHAVTRLSHFFAGAMAKRGVGHVLNVASTAAYFAMPTAAFYSSTKSYMLNFSVAMNYELRGSGVSVTCFCPGPVSTNFCGSGNYLCTKGPGMLLDAKTCARNGLEGMFDAEACLHDTNVSCCSKLLGRVLLPMRLRAFVGAIMMNEPDKIFAMLKR